MCHKSRRLARSDRQMLVPVRYREFDSAGVPEAVDSHFPGVLRDWLLVWEASAIWESVFSCFPAGARAGKTKTRSCSVLAVYGGEL